MMIQEFLRLFTLQEVKKLKNSGRFSLDNSKSPTPKDEMGVEEMNLSRNETNSVLQNFAEDYLKTNLGNNYF